MADTTRRSFLTAATGFAATAATPAMASMSPIYDRLDGAAVATYRSNRGWGARVEYHTLSEVQPEPLLKPALPKRPPEIARVEPVLPKPRPKIVKADPVILDPEPAVARTFLAPAPKRKPYRIVPEYLDSREHRLKIKAQRTGEIFDDVFRAGPVMYDDALGEIDYLLRDWRRDEVFKIDRTLIDLLSLVQEEIGFDNPITVVSGYRSAATNRMLRRQNHNVAKNSYHMRGMAADIRLPGVSTNTVRKLAVKMAAGGVGYYPRAGFIHLDTGPVRTWRG